VQIGPGTRVLVTGASKGIGRAIAQAFAKRGATLALVARRLDPLEQLAEELPGDGHVAIVADVSDPDSIAAAVSEFGDVDVVVANAGITHYRPFAQLPLDEARHMNDVNWLGTIYTVWAALPRMLERGRGHIVIVSSGGGVRGFPSAAVYNGTKSAQRGFAEALRHELNGTGVSVTTVFPGEIVSSLHDHEKAAMPAWYHGDERAAPASELAAAVLAGIEADKRRVAYPREVSLLALNAVAPGLVDRLLRRLRGPSAAPRR